MSVDVLMTSAAFVLTLLIFSYLLGDNPLFRLAVYLFVALAAAFTTIVTFESVIFPLILAVQDGNVTGQESLDVVLLLVAAALILIPSPKRFPVRRVALAFLIAVGAAVAVVGVTAGTLLPFVLSTGTRVADNPLNGAIVIIGVITSLLSFQYLARQQLDGSIVRGRFTAVMSGIGQVFIAVTLGAVYGAAILTSLTILTERLSFLMGGLP